MICEHHRYGNKRSQFGELFLPDAEGPFPVAVLIHGGFWKAQYDLSLGRPLAASLVEEGWAAWNLEYRRVGYGEGGGGGTPQTFDDVAAGIDRLAGVDGLDTSVVVTLGHSAGGHLAAWAAARGQRDGASLPGGRQRVRVTATVPQAGVLDLLTAATEGLGGSAVPDLVGGTPARVPGRYLLADPVERHMSAPLPIIGSGEPVSAAVGALGTADALLVHVDGKPAGVVTRQDVLGHLVGLTPTVAS